MRVAVIAGGRSAEHEVSLLSAQSVAAGLLEAGFDVLVLGVTRAGQWGQVPLPWLLAQPADVRQIALPTDMPAVQCLPQPGAWLRDADGQVLAVDVAFPLIHGTLGEDGCLQGLLEWADVAYVGCGVAASANAMNKALTRRLVAQTGVAQPAFRVLSARALQAEGLPALAESLAAELGWPLFAKAAELGSSVGVYRCTDTAALQQALRAALAYGDQVLVESAVEDAWEIEVSVLGNEWVSVSCVGEIVTSRDFYDYEDKYVLGQSVSHIPAALPEAVSERVREAARQVYVALGCEGMARVDFRVTRDSGTPFLLEVNTLPGFTSISMFPKLWAASGKAYPELLRELVTLAHARAERRRARVVQHQV